MRRSFSGRAAVRPLLAVAALLPMLTLLAFPARAAAQVRPTGQPGTRTRKPAATTPATTPAAKPATPAAPALARLEGDVYLVMQSGDTKRGAGNTIFLIPDSAAFRQTLATICARHHERDSTLTVAYDSAQANVMTLIQHGAFAGKKVEAAMAAQRLAHQARMAHRDTTIMLVKALLLVRAVAHTGTGMNAHYVFTDVVPGHYRLLGEWTIGDHPYQWWTEVDVAAGQAIVKDLDNAAEANGQLYCGIQ